jgi:Flp pilus assembly protein TadD
MPDPQTAADAAFNLGLALQSQQRFEEARLAYERALTLEPTRPDAANNLATV